MTSLPVKLDRLFLPIVLATALALTACSSKNKGDDLDTDAAALTADDSGGGVDADPDLSLGGGDGAGAVSPDLAKEELSQGDLSATGSAGAPSDLNLDAPPPDVGASGAPPSPDIPSPDLSMADNGVPPPPPDSMVPPDAPAMSGGDAEITDLRYSSQDGGNVVIVTSQPASYRTREVPERNQVVVEIENARLPAKFKRPYITKDFQQPLTSMNAYQDAGSTTVRVVLQFKTPTRADVAQNGRTLTVMSSSGASAMSAPEPESGAVSTAAVSSGGAQGGSDDPRILPAAAIDGTGYDNLRFYGRPISVEVRDTPIRDVINLIAEQSGANIILSNDVDGTISLKLRQIPWDQALLMAMKTKNLGYVRQGSILRIAPYEALQKETEAARRVSDAQKAAEPLRVKIIPVSYAKVDALEKQIIPFLTLNRGRVVGDTRTNSVVVTDTPEVLERIQNLVRTLDTPPLQVLIEGKVVEARETFGREVGVNWGFSGQDVDMGGKLFNNQTTVTNGRLEVLGLNSSFRFGTFDVFGDLNATLSLFEREDLVHVVSSPRVVALNNEQASIVQGTNIGVQQITQTAGQTTLTTSYQPVEMRLEVTPQVTSESDIILTLNIKREFASNRINNQSPDINRREAKTKVLVRNGQTAVVGGVYQADTNDVENGVPWLRNIPVLGWLFKKKSISNEKSELLVFLTPRILNAESSMPKGSTL
jgi:type IV pilus assembly protein PilQ